MTPGRSTDAKAFVALLAFLSVAGCATVRHPGPPPLATDPRAAASEPGPSAEAGLQPIDAHTHTIFVDHAEPFSKVMMSESEYFSELGSIGAVGAVALEVPPGVTSFGTVESVHDLKARGVVNCAGISDRTDFGALERGLASGRFGCIKIYLGYVRRYAYDPHYAPVYRLAEKFGVPVIFHAGDTYSEKALLKYSQPLTVDEVAVAHPRVTFVIAHCGYPWIQDAAEVAYKNPNVVLDGSGFAVGDLDQMAPEKVDEYVVKPLRWVFGYLEDPKKLMYGTDWPLVRMEPYFRAFKRAIPREHWREVFHDNAARVFRLN